MSTMIQIRNVPEALHRKLKVRAAQAGMSLSDYLLKEIGRSAQRPTTDEIRARLESWPEIELSPSAEEMVRAERDGR